MSVYPQQRSPGPRHASPPRGSHGRAGPLGANDNLRSPANDFGPERGRSYYSHKFGGIRGGLWALEEQMSVSALLLDYADDVLNQALSLRNKNFELSCDVGNPCGPPWAGAGWSVSTEALGCSVSCRSIGITGAKWPPPYARPGVYSMRWDREEILDPLYAWKPRAMYVAASPQPVGYMFTVPAPWLNPEVPDVPLWLDPFSQPVVAPTPTPVPPPYWAIPDLQPNPWRAPSEQPQRGPAPKARPRPRPRPRFRPRPDGEPPPLEFVPPPAVDPAPSVDGAPWIKPGHNASRRPGPKGRPLAGGHVRRPPGPNEKERKGALPGPLAAAMKAAFAATEAVDAIDAIYDATGTPAQRKAWEGKHGSTPQSKAAFIYNNAGSIDLSDAAMNLLQNEIGDRIVGGVAGGAGDFLQGTGNIGGGILL